MTYPKYPKRGRAPNTVTAALAGEEENTAPEINRIAAILETQMDAAPAQEGKAK